MYYRDDSGLGCLIGMLIGFLFLSAFLKILFTPAFWVVIAIIFVISAIQRHFGIGKSGRTNDNGGSGGGGYTYTEYRSTGSTQNRSGVNDFDIDDFSEGTNDPTRMEQVYESNAVDVDVEVIKDDKE